MIEDIGFEKDSCGIYFQSYLLRKSIYIDYYLYLFRLILRHRLNVHSTQEKADVC